MPTRGPMERSLAAGIAARPAVSPSPTPKTNHQSSALPISNTANTVSQGRKRQLVSTFRQRRTLIQWPLSQTHESGQNSLPAMALRKFPHIFPGSYKTNHSKVSFWWKNTSKYISLSAPGRRPGNFSSARSQGRKRKNTKAVNGRGRKREQWVKDLYVPLKVEFDQLHSMNLKLSPSFLACAAKKT